MREAILVAMHDSKNVVYVEDKDNKLIVECLAPQHRALFRDVTRIVCHWWGDRNTIELHITGAGGEETILLYQGSYTAILAPPEPPTATNAFVSGEMYFPADAIKGWVEKQ